MGAVRAWAAAGGARTIRLSVSERNEAARRFYTALGFVPTGRSEPLVRDPATRTDEHVWHFAGPPAP